MLDESVLSPIEKDVSAPRRLGFLIGVLLVFLYAVLVTYTLYANGFFGFHDLGLINDWFNNAFRGRPFFVSQYGSNHLGKHVTPSLLLLLPWYWATDSQYVLLAVGSFCFAWTFVEVVLFMQTYAHRRYQEDVVQSRWYWVCLVFALVLTHTPYPKTVLLSGHFEILFVPLALRTTNLFIQNSHPLAYYATLLIAAGVRQDAGIFLLALLLGMALHLTPKPIRWMAKQRLFYSAVVLVVYVAVVMFVLMPRLGADQNVKLWSAWGNGWTEIALHMLCNPRDLIATVADSGFVPLLASFGFLPLVAAPGSFLLAHLPALAMYTLDDSLRRNLFWYNSAFLLPSCLIFSSMALLRITHWQKMAAWKSLPQAMTVLLLVYFFFILKTPAPQKKAPAYVVRTRVYSGSAAKAQKVKEVMSVCKKNATVATDFYTFTYLPLGTENYLLDHWPNVDVVVFDPRVKRLLRPNPDPEWLEQRLQQIGYQKIFSSADLVAYLKPDSRACRYSHESLVHSTP